jgi:hypothetical protein
VSSITVTGLEGIEDRTEMNLVNLRRDLSDHHECLDYEEG